MAIMSPAAMASLRDEILASVRPRMAGTVDPTTASALAALQASLGGTSSTMQALSPFLTGAPGSSPLTAAAIEAFKQNTMPILQNQMTLRGLGHSPAVSQVTGEALATALPQFITTDMTNRLRAAELVNAERQNAANVFSQAGGRAVEQGQNAATQAGTILDREANLGLTGARLSSDIANQEAMRQIEAARTAGQLQLGAGDLAARTAQIQQEQQRLALQAGQGAGGLQRDIQQQVADSVQAERLRLQGLSEGASTGLFGGSVLPPNVLSKTTSKSSK